MSVFISYSSKDQKMSDRVYNSLSDKNIKCWKADIDLIGHAGINYNVMISRAIKSCEVFVVLYSQFAIDSDYVSGELQCAINHKKTIITFFIEDVELDEAHEVLLNTRQQIKILDNQNRAIEILYRSILNVLSGKMLQDINQNIEWKNREIGTLTTNQKKGFFSKLVAYFTNKFIKL